jgi:MoaA/NifB/PqqE/SkfB family radical SAM enzyme/predicted SAM-dependent methyltransferase
MAGSHGWAEVSRERKREIIAAIAAGSATRGPVHAELDLTDRCNVACYFCNQMDVRTKQQIPLERAVELIDELVEGGLRSVRLSGGGDPLFHREILPVLDHLTARGIVVDNLTTNGVLLGPEVAERLIVNGCRETIFSLNAVDDADYHRMMKVKTGTFDKVITNVRGLVDRRDRAGVDRPVVIVQFLIDRANYTELPRMARLGRDLGADRVVIAPVLEIPLERVDTDAVLHAKETELLRPYLREALAEDRDGQLQIDFPYETWNRLLAELRAELAAPTPAFRPTAPSFQEKNGHCFFGWYTATVRGNGDLYPCCMLMSPDYPPLGNVLTGPRSFADHWNGASFQRLRHEMREVMLRGGRMFFRKERFQHLRPQCVNAHQCGLKNMYFRGDEELYHELGEALDQVRAREVRWLGSPRQIARAAEVLWYRVYHRLRVERGKARDRWQGARATLHARLAARKTSPETIETTEDSMLFRKKPPAAPVPNRLHVGAGRERLEGWVNIDNQALPGVDVVADVTGGLKFSDVEAIFAEHFLEHLPLGSAIDFFLESHRVLRPGAWMRLSTPNLDWVWKTHYRLDAEGADKRQAALALNRAFHGWEHQFLWNREMLEEALLACGFTDLRWCRYRESENPLFQSLERHETYGDEPALPHVLIVEARKGEPQPDRLSRLRELLAREFLNHLKG